MKRLLTLGVLLILVASACGSEVAELSGIVRTPLPDMGDDAEHINVAMATIDPGRDTDEIITDYVQSFVPGAHGLRTGDEGELRAAADVFGADYDVTITDDGDYEVIHTAHLYAIDDTGHLQVTWAFGTEPETIAQDLQILLGAQ